MNYNDAVIEWLATTHPMPSILHVYRATALMSASTMIYVVLKGQEERRAHNAAMDQWENEGGKNVSPDLIRLPMDR